MIEAFVASWPLFHATYLTGAAIAALLALGGVLVVARDQVFLGAAIAQASTLGIATLLWVSGTAIGAGWPALESESAARMAAVAASVTTALASARPRRPGHESPEARTAWIFLVAASVPVLLLAHSAHGLEEVHRLMFSTLLGVTDADAALFATLALASAVAVARWHAPLRLFAMDPEMAGAVGLPVRGIARAFALWLGIAVGLSIQASGWIYTFGCLVLPALAAKNASRELGPVLWRAPLVAVIVVGAAFVVANAWDLPPAHAAVTGLAGAVAASWLVRRR